MKNKWTFLTAAITLAVLLWPAGQTYGQEGSREQKEKEKQIQESIDAQKKIIIDQHRSQEELQEILEEKNKEIQEIMKDVQVKIGDSESFNRAFRMYEFPRGGRQGEFYFTPGSNLQAFWEDDDSERTSWEFSKSIREGSFSRDYSIDVEKGAKNVVMSVNGNCDSGDIRIKIVMPNGKTYSDIVIDEFGDLNWKKSLSISEEENKDKAGEWKFSINASKASGHFRISLQTY